MAILFFSVPSSPSNPSMSSFPKAGSIVSKKLSAKAVIRNDLKRRLRAALRQVLSETRSPLQLVVLPNRRSLGATVAELEKEMRQLILK